MNVNVLRTDGVCLGSYGWLFSALVFGLGHLVYRLVLGAVFATVNGITPVDVRGRAPVR